MPTFRREDWMAKGREGVDEAMEEWSVESSLSVWAK